MIFISLNADKYHHPCLGVIPASFYESIYLIFIKRCVRFVYLSPCLPKKPCNTGLMVYQNKDFAHTAGIMWHEFQ